MSSQWWEPVPIEKPHKATVGEQTVTFCNRVQASLCKRAKQADCKSVTQKHRWFESITAYMYKNISDFYDKIDNEGGMYEAVVGYGLLPHDLDAEKFPEIHEKYVEFCELATELSHFEDEILWLIQNAIDEEEDYEEN